MTNAIIWTVKRKISPISFLIRTFYVLGPCWVNGGTHSGIDLPIFCAYSRDFDPESIDSEDARGGIRSCIGESIKPFLVLAAALSKRITLSCLLWEDGWQIQNRCRFRYIRPFPLWLTYFALLSRKHVKNWHVLLTKVPFIVILALSALKFG